MFKLAKTLTHEYLGLNSAVLHLGQDSLFLFSMFLSFFTLHLMLLFIGIFFYLLSRFLQYKGGTVNI